MAMTAASSASAEPAQACVHAATASELDAAREALQAAGELVAQQGDPPRLCHLDFHTLAADRCGSWDPRLYFDALGTAALGRVLLTAAALPSTQTLVQDNVARLPDGLVVVADRQLGGKGRGGNAWESPPGCLMFSACRRLDVAGPRLPFVQYLASLAVVQAVQAEAAAALGEAPAPGAAPLDVRIKWPNDVYAGGLKLGGVLCHSSYRGQRFHVIMGVGLNLANREPTTCVDALIEAEAASRGLPPPAPVSREASSAATRAAFRAAHITRALQPGFETLSGMLFAHNPAATSPPASHSAHELRRRCWRAS
jgi:biotin--protein ligase